jgi:hypothetical protein
MYKKWLNYWKNSLVDSQRLQVDFEKEKHFIIKDVLISSGAIPISFSEALFQNKEQKHNKKRGVKDALDPKWVQLKQIDVLLSVFSVVPIAEHLSHHKSSKPAYPFWIKAGLNREGVLTVPEEPFPLIPRPHLIPSAGKEADFILGNIDVVDKAAAISQVSVKDWDDYIKYLSEVFYEITQQDIDSFAVEGYRLNPEIIIFSLDEEQGAASGIINLYHHLIDRDEISGLFQNLIQPDKKRFQEPVRVDKYMDDLSLHLGQMGDSFPLSITQRKTLNTYLSSDDHTVFAVNGPPGTGKTTLLQSVVANEIVAAAVKGDKAPIILACSSNNQAVQNINESFSRTESSLQKLSGRWLPNFEGYASYLPSNKKSANELNGINFIKLDGSGTFKELESFDYLDKAKSYFLNKITTYKNQRFTNIEQSAKILRNEILEIQSLLNTFSRKWRSYTIAWENFKKVYHPIILIDDYVKDNFANRSLIQKDVKWFENAEESVIEYYKDESIFRKIGCFLGFKSSLSLRVLEIDKIFKSCPVGVLQKLNREKYQALTFCNEQINILEALEQSVVQWETLCYENGIEGNPPQQEEELWKLEWNKINNRRFEPCYFYDELDIKFRHKAFQLAVHYWEARWLSEVSGLITDSKKDSKGYYPTINRWEIRSMLTPCYVSTFYMAPKFFSYWEWDDENEGWANPPLTNLLDVLMIDEAGQTTPEVGVAIFGLARKAIVVGDIKQIEPIWNIPSKIDVGNLSKNDLLSENTMHSMNEYELYGVLASNGSIMKMAQIATSYKEKDTSEKGLLLREHRRCYDEIIGYCNLLAYDGQLVPMKGPKSNESLFSAMGILHVDGNSITRNRDRFNLNEVNAITEFLVKNKTGIESLNGKTVEEEVGIITPFVGQKRALIRAIESKGFDVYTMKIGTVHALQGAERSIILFSSVYGEGDVGTMFFDRDNKPNMLNVAVSRAKESFIVFGNKRIFNPKSNSPSGILARYLRL